MQVQITGKAEHIVQEKIETGRFPSVEAVVEEAILSWSEHGNGTGASKECGVEGTKTMREIVAEFSDVWPEEDSVDEFLQWKQEMRERDLERQDRLLEELEN